jgi:hypothetical protein
MYGKLWAIFQIYMLLLSKCFCRLVKGAKAYPIVRKVSKKDYNTENYRCGFRRDLTFLTEVRSC